MDSNAAEVMAEARLHEGARRRVERLSGRTQHIVDDGRSYARRMTCFLSLQSILFFHFAVCAFVQEFCFFFFACGAASLQSENLYGHCFDPGALFIV